MASISACACGTVDAGLQPRDHLIVVVVPHRAFRIGVGHGTHRSARRNAHDAIEKRAGITPTIV